MAAKEQELEQNSNNNQAVESHKNQPGLLSQIGKAIGNFVSEIAGVTLGVIAGTFLGGVFGGPFGAIGGAILGGFAGRKAEDGIKALMTPAEQEPAIETRKPEPELVSEEQVIPGPQINNTAEMTNALGGTNPAVTLDPQLEATLKNDVGPAAPKPTNIITKDLEAAKVTRPASLSNPFGTPVPTPGGAAPAA